MMVLLAAIIVAITTPDMIFAPHVQPGQTFAAKTTLHRTGTFTHTTTSEAVLEIMAPRDSARPALHFFVKSSTDGMKSEREFQEDLQTFRLFSIPENPVIGIAPLAYTTNLFGQLPAALEVGTTWKSEQHGGIFGDSGILTSKITQLDSAQRICIIDLSFEGTWNSHEVLAQKPLTGTVHRRSHGTAKFVDGILINYHIKGSDHSEFTGDAFDDFFEAERNLEKR